MIIFRAFSSSEAIRIVVSITQHAFCQGLSYVDPPLKWVVIDLSVIRLLIVVMNSDHFCWVSLLSVFPICMVIVMFMGVLILIVVVLVLVFGLV